MSAIIVAPIIASNIAVQNAARANQKRHVEQCATTLALYKPENASVQEMQSYAECVKVVYPEKTSDDVVSMKILVAVLLISMLIGGFIGWVRSDWDKTTDIALGMAIGLATSVTGLCIFGAIVFVFS